MFHALKDKCIGALPCRLRNGEIRSLEIQRIYIIERYKLNDLHSLRGRGFKAAKLLTGDLHVSTAFNRIALSQFTPFNNPLAMRTVELLLHLRSTDGVYLVKTYMRFPSRDEKLNRHRNQAKREITLPDSRSHNAYGMRTFPETLWLLPKNLLSGHCRHRYPGRRIQLHSRHLQLHF